MHIHVHRRRIAFEENKRQGITAFRNRFVITLDQRVAQRAAVDRSLIYEYDHLVSRAPADSRPPDQPRQPHSRLVRVQRHQRFSRLPPKDFRDALRQGRAFRRTKNHAAIFDQRERGARARQGVEPHTLHDVRRFRLIRFEKFPAGRHGVKQMRDFDPRADRPPAIVHVNKFPAVHQYFRTDVRSCLARL
jgi:hypothetical protein